MIFVVINIIFTSQSKQLDDNSVETDHHSNDLICFHDTNLCGIKSIKENLIITGNDIKAIGDKILPDLGNLEICKPFGQKKIYGYNGEELCLENNGVFDTKTFDLDTLDSDDESETNISDITEKKEIDLAQIRILDLEMTLLHTEWNESQKNWVKYFADWKELQTLHRSMIKNEWQKVIDYDAKSKADTNYSEKGSDKDRNKKMDEFKNRKWALDKTFCSEIYKITKNWTKYQALLMKIVELGDKIEKAYFDSYNWVTTYNEHEDVQTRKRKMIFVTDLYKDRFVSVQKLWKNHQIKLVDLLKNGTDDHEKKKLIDKIELYRTNKVPELIRKGVLIILEINRFIIETCDMKKRLKQMLFNGIHLTKMRKSRYIDLNEKQGSLHATNTSLIENLKESISILDEYMIQSELGNPPHVLETYIRAYPITMYEMSNAPLPWAPFIINSSKIKETDIMFAIQMNKLSIEEAESCLRDLNKNILELQNMINQEKGFDTDQAGDI